MTAATDAMTALRCGVVLAAAIAAIGLGRRGAGAMPIRWTCRWWTARPASRSSSGATTDACSSPARPGARYSLRVTNHTDGRVLVVMSVDGVNILTGETAGYGQRGYVFAPHESLDLTGWRKSRREVAAFTFAPLPQSYAARTGRPADVGVIGIAVFKEKIVAGAADPAGSAPDRAWPRRGRPWPCRRRRPAPPSRRYRARRPASGRRDDRQRVRAAAPRPSAGTRSWAPRTARAKSR